MSAMEKIIEGLMTSDSSTINQATAQLSQAYNDPDTMPQLCMIAISHEKPQIRQYAAILMKKRMQKARHWRMVPELNQTVIKQTIMSSIITEKEKTVRVALAQVIGLVMRHEVSSKDRWIPEMLQFLCGKCLSPNAEEAELGSSIFSIMTDVAPDQFVPHLEMICEMFNAVLTTADSNGQLMAPVVYNILISMDYLVPFVVGQNLAEQAYAKLIPIMVKVLDSYALANNKDHFIQAFDVFESMADYAPKLLTGAIKALLDFCLRTANNINLECAIRVRTVSYIGWLVRLKKKVIVKQKLVEPIVQAVFTLMATEPERDEDEDYFTGNDTSNPMTTATQTMDLLALNVPPEKLIPPLLKLMEPALHAENYLARRASFLCLAVIAEGCSEAICNKYLEQMLNIVKTGITDSIPVVRNAAFFALGQFSEHLQPDISKFAPQILPILFEYLHALCEELRSGGHEPKNIDRMFYALETFCENLEEALLPHLPILMERLFEALNPQNSMRVRELAMSTVCAATNSAKMGMLPYFNELIQVLQLYLAKSEDKDTVALRPHAIDALAALARTIGKENFLPLATDTMSFALQLLDEASDPDVRRALYNLVGAMASVVNEEMGAVFPKIIQRLYDSVLSTQEVVPEFKEGNDGLTVPEDDSDREDIDIDHSEAEEDDELENIAGYNVENSYLDEKEEAIMALKEFAENSGMAFLPYIEKSFENVYKMIDHPQEDIRKGSIEALTTFITTLHRHKMVDAVKNAIVVYIPKLIRIVHDDEEVSVVLAALDAIGDVIKDLKGASFPTEQLRETVFTTVTDVMKGKVACQFEDTAAINEEEAEESEYEEAIVESAGNVLTLMGLAMSNKVFNEYFTRIYPLILQKLTKSKKNRDMDSQRAFAYGTLAECFSPLNNNCPQYFDMFAPLLIEGVTDKFDQARHNAVFGLGELAYYAQEKSYGAFPTMLHALSNAITNETNRSVLDNICGAIGRLIVTNWQLVPLPQVLPILMSHMPLTDDVEENGTMFRAFEVLYNRDRATIADILEKLVALGLHVLKMKGADEDTKQIIRRFLKLVQNDYPEMYDRALATSEQQDTVANPEEMNMDE